jgi:hypothetical protein
MHRGAAEGDEERLAAVLQGVVRERRSLQLHRAGWLNSQDSGRRWRCQLLGPSMALALRARMLRFSNAPAWQVCSLQ